MTSWDYVERHGMQDQCLGYLMEKWKGQVEFLISKNIPIHIITFYIRSKRSIFKLDHLMSTQWDLLILDDLLAPIAYSIGVRMLEERGIPYIMFPSCGEQTATSMEQRSMGI
jgi:hypothetical protein